MPPFGQSSKKTFTLLRDNPTQESALSFSDIAKGCCLTLPVLAEETVTSQYYNDVYGFIFFWGTGFSTADLKLEKYKNGSWQEVESLIIDTWGTHYDFGFFENRLGEKAIAYQLEWQKVLVDTDLGEGNYRVKSSGTQIIASGTVTQYSFEFCLQKYTEYRADETVRFDYNLNGLLGSQTDDRLRRDFGNLNFACQFRLPGAMFGFDKYPSERKYVRYQNGKQVWIQDSSKEEYIFKTGKYDQPLHKFIKNEILQSDDLRVTDYNILNPTRHQGHYVIATGNYEPKWDPQTIYAPAEITFEQGYQNNIRKRS